VPVSDVPVQIKSTRSGRKIQQNTIQMLVFNW